MARRPDLPAEPPTPDWTDPPAGAPLDALLGSYGVPAGHFDELRDEHGTLRPHWQSFAREASDLSAEIRGLLTDSGFGDLGWTRIGQERAVLILRDAGTGR